MMLNKAPTIWQLERLVRYAIEGGCQAGLADGRWVPARPCGFYSLGSRWRAAWLVFTGRADAVEWPDQ